MPQLKCKARACLVTQFLATTYPLLSSHVEHCDTNMSHVKHCDTNMSHVEHCDTKTAPSVKQSNTVTQYIKQ